MRPFFLLVPIVLLALAGCDSGSVVEPPVVDPPTAPQALEFRLNGGRYTTYQGDVVSAGVNDCRVDRPNAPDLRVEGGVLRLDPQGTFGLELAVREPPYDATANDTLDVSGAYERAGGLLTLRPDNGGVWYASIGPNASAPTTVALVDATREEDVVRLGGACVHYVFTALSAAEDFDIAGGVRAGTYDLVRAGDRRLPYRFGTSRSWRSNDSARVALREDGTYTFTVWSTAAPCSISNPDCAPPQSYTQSAEGAYVNEGDLYLFDPGKIGDRAFASGVGDSLIVPRPPWEVLSYAPGELAFARR